MIKRNLFVKGFSLLEVMVVVVIIGLLASVVTVSVMSYLDTARRTTAEAQMKEFLKALDFYKMDKGSYPTSGQGLKALLQKRSGSDEFYLKEVPLDPWGGEYRFKSTGSQCEITSYGADKRAGGDGSSQDITVSSHGSKKNGR